MSIQALLQAKTGCRAIARQLGVSASTVYREVSRGKPAATDAAVDYRARPAQAGTRRRRSAAAACRRKLGADMRTPLWRTVLDGLRCGWSPEQIAGKLPRMDKATTVVELPLESALVSVSHETIYAMPRGTLRSELVGLLRKSDKTRLPRARGTARKDGMPNRPPSICARRGGRPHRPWPLEGDLIKGAMNRSSVGTLVERTSRYVMLVKLDGGTAPDILEGTDALNPSARACARQ